MLLEDLRPGLNTDPLARGQFALCVLRVNPALTAALTGHSTALFQLVENVFHGRPPQNRLHHSLGAHGNKAESRKFA